MPTLTPHDGVARLPVGSLVVVAPPGSGKSTILRGLLTAAGLPESHIVNRDDLRTREGARCKDLAHRVAPATCLHYEADVDTRVNTLANAHLVEGRTWLYDQTGTNRERLAVEIDRAHQRGLAAVALRRTANDGSGDLPLAHCQEYNAARDRRVPAEVVEAMWQSYQALNVEQLYALGFDLVIEWNESTQFELLPSGMDARNVHAPLVVVGDIHGCAATFFDELLPAVGTDRNLSNPTPLLVSVGDIHDKGQHSVEVIRWWLWALRTGRAVMTDSNHNKALLRALTDPDTPVRGSVAKTVAQIEAEPDASALKQQIVAAFSRLPSHLVFPEHVVVHAAMTRERLFRTDAKTRGFALHHRASKSPWEWTGPQTLLHGHVTVPAPERRRAAGEVGPDAGQPGEVIALDTGAYTGGGLSAYLSVTDETITVPTVPTDQIDPAEAAELEAELVAAGIIPAA